MSKKTSKVGRRDILEIAGAIDDGKVAAIERTGATVGELETAVAWASGLSGAMSEERQPLSGVVAEIYEILTADEEYEDENG